MRTALFAFLALSFLGAPAFAAEDTDCQQLSDDVWGCPIPTKPPGPPICHVFGASLICSAPVVVTPLPEKKAPSNCGWSRKAGRYVCW